MMLLTGFVLGAAGLQWAAMLPSAGVALGMGGLAVALGWAARKGVRGAKGLYFLAGLLAGAVWASVRGEAVLADRLVAPPRAVAVVEGVVAGLPQRLADGGVRFELADVRLAEPESKDSADMRVPTRVRLGWYAPRRVPSQKDMPPELRPGERWRLAVRLKPPHGVVNPQGWLYEQWLFESGVRATGTVVRSGENRRVSAFAPSLSAVLNRTRDAVRTRFAETLGTTGKPCCTGLLTALAVGDQQAIDSEDWQTFRNTGVAHLVSISGLHVSLMALLAVWLVNLGWRALPTRMAVRHARRRVALVAGWLAAAAYTLLSGLETPALRAFLMLSVAAAFFLSGRETAPGRVLLAAAVVVLLWQPWAVLAAGFWLSFGAVAVILWCTNGRFLRPTAWRAALSIQWAITLASLPALLHFFGGFPLTSMAANAVAIPVVSFLITPLTLLALLIPWGGLLHVANALAAALMVYLEWLGALPHALWQPATPPLPLVLLATGGLFWALLPRGTPARRTVLLACLPLLCWQPPPPPKGTARVTLLDVGQGLAVHIQTARHHALYDTGPAYGERSAAETILLPYFAAQGVTRLDTLLLSHNDLDHTGGAPTLLATLPVGELRADFPVSLPHTPTPPLFLPCTAGQSWTWDGVRFDILHPLPDDTADTAHDNDRSCLLRVRAGGHALLLTGDLTARGEAALLARGADLAADIVQVGHHGSATSSTAAFIAATDARHALVSAGFHNAFHHPAPAALHRWQQHGTTLWRTDQHGALTFTLAPDTPPTPESERLRHPRYWLAAPQEQPVP